MAVHDLRADDGAADGAAELTTGHECPACGAAVLNGQGLYACLECEFTLVPTLGTEREGFDHPVFRL